MKKMLAILLLAAMMLTLCACGKKTETTPAPAESAAPEAAAEADRTAEIEEAGGPICEYCGRHHGTSWFAQFLYGIHNVFKMIKDLFAKING